MVPIKNIVLLTAVLCLANIATADYWRFNLKRYHCVEPREWKTDKVAFFANWVTTTHDGQVKQNGTTSRKGFTYVDRGYTSHPNVMWQDIMLSEEESNLLFAFTMWNLGDEDPQKVGLGKFSEQKPSTSFMDTDKLTRNDPDRPQASERQYLRERYSNRRRVYCPPV
jgi:hypothetical protein